MDKPVSWTAEKRLDVLACLLAHKRAEAMGRVSPAAARRINHESMLGIAVFPPEALDEVWEDLAPLCQTNRAALKEALYADIRALFPPDSRPAWV